MGKKPTLNTREVTSSDNGRLTDKYTGMTGAEIFHQMLQEHNVKVMFGYTGGAVLALLDAIYESPHFRFILPRHEQGAGHMAQGYARASGDIGVVLVTSGPGATNTVTALQDANMDGTPLIVFCGQVTTTAIGTDAFQEADITGITRPCTKWNALVKHVRDLPSRINAAFHIATSGRPGPVLVDLPKDVSAAVLKQKVCAQPHLPGYHTRQVSSSSQIESAAEMINAAKRPLFYVGQGVITAGAADVLRQCVEAADIPVTTTLLGLGAFDETSPCSAHMLGMHGSAYANWAMRDADCVIAVGARFDDRVTGKISEFAPTARAAERRGSGGFIHFDIAPEQINKAVPVTLGVEGDARKNLELLLPLLEKRDRSEWLAQIGQWKAEHPFRYKDDGREFHLKPQAVIEELFRQTDGQAVITSGVGQHQMWAAQFYQFRYPRQWITSGGLGTMGFGVPASIGAKVAVGDKTVVNIDGDGSFSMTGMEMATAASHGIAAKTIIMNNGYQGMVKQWQDLFFAGRYSHTEMTNPDFVKLVEATGCRAERCTKKADVPKAISRLLEHDGPMVLECTIDRHEHVYPMMPAGKTVHDMVLGDFD